MSKFIRNCSMVGLKNFSRLVQLIQANYYIVAAVERRCSLSEEMTVNFMTITKYYDYLTKNDLVTKFMYEDKIFELFSRVEDKKLNDFALHNLICPLVKMITTFLNLRIPVKLYETCKDMEPKDIDKIFAIYEQFSLTGSEFTRNLEHPFFNHMERVLDHYVKPETREHSDEVGNVLRTITQTSAPTYKKLIKSMPIQTNKFIYGEPSENINMF